MNTHFPTTRDDFKFAFIIIVYSGCIKCLGRGVFTRVAGVALATPGFGGLLRQKL